MQWQSSGGEVTMDKLKELIARITDCLAKGGLFNMEVMEAGKVRDLLIDCRQALATLEQPDTLAEAEWWAAAWNGGMGLCPESVNCSSCDEPRKRILALRAVRPVTGNAPRSALERAREVWSRAVEKRGDPRNKGKTLAIFAVEEFTAELARCEAEVRARTALEEAMTENTFGMLSDLVSKVSCKPGWEFELVNEDGALHLVITVPGRDSYRPENPLTVRHFFPVPTTTYNAKTWRRWIFEMCRRLENHELGEWFQIGGARPFAPLHGPGEDPYTVHEFRDELDAQIVQDGSVSPLVKTH